MDLQLAGKVVAITGGTAGIGLAVATRFWREGCKVAVCGRREEKRNCGTCAKNLRSGS